MLLQGLPHNYSNDLQRRRRPLLPGHLRKAEDYLRNHLETPLRLADLAAASGCSIRSLQEGFSSHFGSTPTAMLLRLRLEQARADLGRRDQPLSVQANCNALRLQQLRPLCAAISRRLRRTTIRAQVLR